MTFIIEYGPQLLAGLMITLGLALVSWIAAFVLSLLLTVVRMTQIRMIEYLVLAFIEYQRNVPPLVHLFMWYFGVSSILPAEMQDFINENHGEYIFAVIAIGLYYGAYFCEDIRSGLRSIPKGQYEAARAIGLGYGPTMLRVILPQALRVSIPPLVSGTVLLVKTTSLAMIIGVMELTYVTKEVASSTFKIFPAYGASTVLYVAAALCLLFIGNWLSNRFQIRGR